MTRLARIVAMAWTLMLAWCVPAFALDPRLEVSQYGHSSWKIRDGFSKGPVRSITQTPDGYLWLATEFGLLRFDGVRAVAWQPPGDQPLPSSDIVRVLASRDGALWIGTSKGLARWKNGRLTQYAELTGRFVMAILEDSEGTVWASGTAVPSGILCAIREQNVTCTGDTGIFGFAVLALYEDRSRNLWVGSSGGLWRWRPAPPSFFRLPGSPDSVQAFDEDRDGQLLVPSRSGVRRFVNGRLDSYRATGPGQQAVITRLLRDRDGALWAGTRSEGILHIAGGRTDVFSEGDGLSGGNVEALFEDREGNVWVATTDGLDRFRGLAASTISRKQGLSAANAVRASSDGSVWMSTSEGIEQRTNDHVRKIRVRGLRDAAVGNFVVDDGGRTWVATTLGIGYLEQDTFVATDTSARAVRSMVKDEEGIVWVTDQYRGLLRQPPSGRAEWTTWAALGHKDFATALTVDRRRGGLWLGFWDGGIAYFEDGGIREAFTTRDGLGGGRIAAFRFGPDASLWVATQSGLSTLRNGQFSTITSENGLPCDAVHSIIDDDLGSVWLNTACGLVRAAAADIDAWVADRRRRIKVEVFDSSDGVRSNASPAGYEPFVAKAGDGRLWFVRESGVDIVDPSRLPFNSLPPPVHVEQVIADRRPYDAGAVAGGQMLLPALTRDLQIDYTALSLVAPEKMRFRYLLEGYDAEWHDVGTRRQAFYNDLPPRRYRFRVLASNNSGVWNETGAALELSIAPAYYQTIWFRVAVVATMLLVLAALYRLRVVYLARRFNLRMEERVNERTRIARDLHDTLLQSFQGALLKFHAITYEVADRPQTKQKLEGVIDQAMQAISEGRDAVQGLRSSTLAGNDLARALGALGEELARDHSGDSPPACSVQVEGAPRDLAPLVHDDVYRIGAEALRNAFRHAEAQRIEIEIRYGQRVFRLRVRDDGKGMDPTVLAEGGRDGHFGLAGMHERASLIKGKLAIWSERDSGTEAELVVPASTAYSKSPAGPHTSDMQAT